MNQEPNESLDLDWLAFRYVAGELPADEAQTLERRMADDQSLREAVSRAVVLGLTLASVRPSVLEPAGLSVAHGRIVRAQQFRRLAWAGFALAASIFLTLGAYWSWAGRGAILGPDALANRPIAQAATADAWLQLRGMDDVTRQFERRLSDWEPNEVPDTQVRQRIVVPRWLIEVAMTDAEKRKHD